MGKARAGQNTDMKMVRSVPMGSMPGKGPGPQAPGVKRVSMSEQVSGPKSGPKMDVPTLGNPKGK